MLSLKKSRDIRLSIPIDTGHLLCERAEERWHSRAGVVQVQNRAVVQVLPPRSARMGIGVMPIGSFTVVFGSPIPSQAAITKLEWDPAQGGTEDGVRQAINSLVGWPIANDSDHSQPAAAAAHR